MPHYLAQNHCINKVFGRFQADLGREVGGGVAIYDMLLARQAHWLLNIPTWKYLLAKP